MAELVNIAIVGCGGMGRRHLAGLAELAKTDETTSVWRRFAISMTARRHLGRRGLGLAWRAAESVHRRRSDGERSGGARRRRLHDRYDGPSSGQRGAA